MYIAIASLLMMLKASLKVFIEGVSNCLCPKNALQKTPATAPSNCPKKNHMNLLIRYWFCFFKQLERVMVGLILAPHIVPENTIARNKHPAA